MAKYYRNGKAVAEPDIPKRTLGNEPDWVWVGSKRKAVCRECKVFRAETSFISVWDAGMQQYVHINTCKTCDSRLRFQDKPEHGLWESCYWIGAEDTTGYSISSSTAVERIPHNPEFLCGTRVHITPCIAEM